MGIGCASNDKVVEQLALDDHTIFAVCSPLKAQFIPAARPRAQVANLHAVVHRQQTANIAVMRVHAPGRIPLAAHHTGDLAPIAVANEI